MLTVAILLVYAFSVKADRTSEPTSVPSFSPVAPGDRIITGNELKRGSLTDWWEALIILEPSVCDDSKTIYGDTPGYLPASVTTRGKNHWTMNSDRSSLPLFVMDGARVPLRQIMSMNINDISMVIIYKNPVSLSRFGINGANGVIELITRRPDSQRLKVSYLFDAIFQNADLSTQKTPAIYSASPANTDWRKIPLQTGFQNRHKLDIQGGDDYVKYKFSARLSPSGSGVMKGSGSDILGLESYIEYNMRALHISNDIVFNRIKGKGSTYGTYDYFRSLNPAWAATDPSGLPYTTLGTEGNGKMLNPVYEASLNSFDETKTYEVYDNLNVNLRLGKYFSVDGMFAFARETTRHDIYISPSSGLYRDEEANHNTGRYDILRDNTLSFEGALSLRYGLRTGKSDIGASGGVRVFSGKYYAESYAGIGIPTDRMAYISFTKSYDTDMNATASRNHDHTLQGMLTAHYSFDGRYSIRGDVNVNRSSRLAPGKRNAWFYGVGLDWNIHNEVFLRDSGIKSLVLNASAGTTGGVGFTDDDFNVTYVPNIGNEYIYNYYLIGSAIQAMPNHDIKWHTVHARNLNLSVEYKRLSLNVSYYDNLTKDALIFTRLPLSTGWENTISNGGEIRNNGVEFRLNADILDNVRGWSLGAFVNGSHNRNRIKKLPEYFQNLYNAGASESGNAESGTYSIVPELHQGKPIDGGIAPDFKGNIGLNLNYMGWWLNTILDCSLGGKAYNWFADDSSSPRYIDCNEFGLGSLQLGYSFAPEICRKIHMSDLTLAFAANNAIRACSSDVTRGILYPYARSFALSLRISF